MRRVLPIGMLILAGFYWLWPYDLLPDAGPLGYLDDSLVLLVFAFVAGRFSKFKPAR
jgi:uncharacterized membrane protein YkvA (DUF1232 family)